MNCQPGDLAISLNCVNPENEGLIVRVIRRHVNTPQWDFRARAAWWCTSAAPMVWEVRGQVIVAHEGPIPDDQLRPIRPPRPTVSQREAKLELPGTGAVWTHPRLSEAAIDSQETR